jgi:hypothetical protein
MDTNAQFYQLQLLLSNPAIFMPIILVIAAFFLALLHKDRQYKKSAYYQITKNPYLFMRFDKGKYGEYLIYKTLRDFEKSGAKLLFNLYIPKGRTKTTEIDVLLISPKGLFVIESKNYNGWIFGNETQRNWTQIIYDYKGQFYNPIMQNRSHISHLKNIVGNIPTQSIIVFSNECTLKEITINSKDVNVINRYELRAFLMRIYNQIQTDLLTETEVNDIYNKLYPYTQVCYDVKEQHIESIRKDVQINEADLFQTPINCENSANFLNKGIYKR